MQTFLISDTTWYFIAKETEPDVPSRIAITPPFRIGRREGFDLCLSCRNVSGLHAEVVMEADQLWIEDLNSTNGTFINGARIRKKTSLRDGDTVQFGQAIFTVACVGDSNAVPHTIVGDSEHVEPETTEERFERLLKGGVVPHFQPIFDISGAKTKRVGYEVLGRSRLFGLKTPDQMFAVATDLEKESELSRALRLRGIEAAESLPEDMMLFVNTHPAEMDCIEIQESLMEIRKKFPTRPIMLELSESVLYTPETYAEMFKVVKDLDVKLVLHDFGAGQIRLAELSEMDPEVVKFDCALIQGIDKAGEKRQRLVAAMVKMVAELGITPMAEYVESAEEHETLKQLGFKFVQGFHYGHPNSIESLVDGTAEDLADKVAKANEPAPGRPVGKLNEIEEPSTVDVRAGLNLKKMEIDLQALEDIFAGTEARKFDGPEKLLQLDDEHFTIQLMFCAKREDAESFVADRTHPGEYAIYRKWSSNREWFVVVYGDYENREQAQEDVKHFEDTGHSSWIRRMNAVKEEIRSIDEQISQ